MTDLAEAVPVQAVATQNDRRVVRRPIEYTAQLDVLQLIVRFLIRARDGAPFSFTTFKDTWKQIGFSHVFQAGPSSRTGLPFLISSLYNFLLDIIKAGSLPLREVFELANPFSTLNQQSLANIASNGHLPALTPENVSWATAPIVQGPPVVATAVYCLYSIYYAQPGPLTVRIRVSKQHQETIKHLTTYLAESNALDALSLLTQLVKDKALLPGSSQESDTSLTNININRTTTVPPAAPGAAARLDSGSGGLGGAGGGGSHSTIPASTLAPGMGALYVVPGLRGKDAATLREVHFHLDSTLTGLGTAHLDPLCRGYGRKLKELWSALGQCELEKDEIIQDKVPAETLRGGRGGRGGANGKKRGTRVAKKSSVKVTAPAPAAPAVAAGVSSVAASEQQQQQQQPEGIADLSMGKYLHEYATTKREELQLTLQYGPKWREKLKKKEQESDKTTAAAGPPPSSAARKRGPRSRKKGDASLSIPGVPGVSRQLLAREKARHIDIARRSQPWAQRMGVDNVIEKEIQAVAAPYTGMMGDSDEDMPLLPGLPSEYEYLAGPSDMAGTGGGPGSTKLTNTTIQGKKGRKKKDGSNSSSDGSTSSSSSSSSSSDSSSSDESDSDGEEVEMEVMAEERGGGSGARRGRGKASAAAAAGRGRGGRGSAGIARASAVSVGSGMRGGKKEKGAKAARGTKRGAEAAAAAEDVQNLLSEIDMALAEDARIQI